MIKTQKDDLISCTTKKSLLRARAMLKKSEKDTKAKPVM